MSDPAYKAIKPKLAEACNAFCDVLASHPELAYGFIGELVSIAERTIHRTLPALGYKPASMEEVREDIDGAIAHHRAEADKPRGPVQ